MSSEKLRVAIIGCGRLGQVYADIYSWMEDTEIVAIVERHPERLKAVGKKYGVTALYTDVESMLGDVVPDIAAVVTPTKYYRDPVIACAEAGVKGISTDKPIAATLSAADDMVNVCEQRGAFLSGGALMRAMPELQEAVGWLREGRFGQLTGASVHGWSGEISGSGCHTISVLRLVTNAEVEEVIAWADPSEKLETDCDWEITYNARFKLSNGIDCPVYGTRTEDSCLVEAWSADSLIRAGWKPPEIYQGFDGDGNRLKANVSYSDYGWDEPPHKVNHLMGAIRSLLGAMRGNEDELWISGRDLRQALEVAIASHISAKRGSVPIRLPLEDRSLTLYPRPYRFVGGDEGEPERDLVFWPKES